MMRKIFAWVCALLLALTPIAHATEDLQVEIDSILSYATAGKPTQKWIHELAENAIGDADNYILALRFMGEDCDFSAYKKALAKSLSDGSEKNPVTRQKNALALIACGGRDLLPEGIVDETTGKLGLMSYVFGLHLVNSGATSDAWTADMLVEKILSLRKADGGWAVTGNYANPDATAMCLQALLNYSGDIALDDVFDQSVDLLSSLQKEDGGYSSFGEENVESSAQVVLALGALGIDSRTDARFIKSGRNLLDVMLSYKLPSGGYAHLPGGSESDMATMQVLQALISLEKIGENIYDFSADDKIAKDREFNWKMYAYAGIGALAVIGCVLSLLKKRGRCKRMLGVILLAIVLACGVMMIDVESADQYYSAEETRNAAGEVYLTIRCDTVAGRMDDKVTPKDGVILPRTAIPYEEGDTVFTVLTRAAQQHRIQMEHDGLSDNMAYIKGMNYLYEFAYGDLSGWMYSVGGEFLSTGCGTKKVQNGDEIIWAYTCQLGDDLK